MPPRGGDVGASSDGTDVEAGELRRKRGLLPPRGPLVHRFIGAGAAATEKAGIPASILPPRPQCAWRSIVPVADPLLHRGDGCDDPSSSGVDARLVQRVPTPLWKRRELPLGRRSAPR